MKKVGILVFCCWFLMMDAGSQHHNITDAWFMPGISYKYSTNVTIQSQIIYLTRPREIASYTQAFLKKGRHLIFNAGYLYLGARIGGTVEHSLMYGVVIHTSVGKMVFENRNLVWNRFRVGREDLQLYRSRLKLSWLIPFQKSSSRIYLFDEAFYSFSLGKWNRNRLAIGYDQNVFTSLNLDIAFVRQCDSNGAVANLFLVLCTIKLDRKT